MNKKLRYNCTLLILVLMSLMSGMTACKHEPILPDDDMPKDTTGQPIDTTTTTGNPCDPELVYFETDVLPLLLSNCAFPACHDAASAEDGVILDTYDNVMKTADVEAFDIGNSEIYEVLVDVDEEERMPPSPTPRLQQSQIQTIAKWILQGAKNLKCDPGANDCETDNVSFADLIQPILTTNCLGCHKGNAPSGGIDLSKYEGLKIVADNGKLYGAVSWTTGFPSMPQGGQQLSSCHIDQIKSWIDAGAPDN